MGKQNFQDVVCCGKLRACCGIKDRTRQDRYLCGPMHPGAYAMSRCLSMLSWLKCLGASSNSPAVGNVVFWGLRPLSSRKELSHEEAPRRRSLRNREVSLCTSPITPSAFWSESKWSSASVPAEHMWEAELVSLFRPSSNPQTWGHVRHAGIQLLYSEGMDLT